LSTTQTIRTTDDAARFLAQELVRASASASLASLSGDGFPLASLTSVATDMAGHPVILVSRLSGHTGNLLADPRAGMLFVRTGKGDPLAHPRISVTGEAQVIDRDSEEGGLVRRRFLRRQPKAALYADFPDFLFIRIQLRQASLNGGFGKAFELTPADLLSPLEGAHELLAAEAEILGHMNEDHAETVGLYATRLGKREGKGWSMVSLDPDGFEAANGSEIVRISFGRRVLTADAVRERLVALAREARAA
jgi:heme iron utilization protein